MERDSWCWTGCSRHYPVDMTSLRVKNGKLWSKEMCLGVTLIKNGLVPWRLGEKMEWRGAGETHNPLCNLPQTLLPSGCGMPPSSNEVNQIWTQPLEITNNSSRNLPSSKNISLGWLQPWPKADEHNDWVKWERGPLQSTCAACQWYQQHSQACFKSQLTFWENSHIYNKVQRIWQSKASLCFNKLVS